jgi:hypothetical protein
MFLSKAVPFSSAAAFQFQSDSHEYILLQEFWSQTPPSRQIFSLFNYVDLYLRTRLEKDVLIFDTDNDPDGAGVI